MGERRWPRAGRFVAKGLVWGVAGLALSLGAVSSRALAAPSLYTMDLKASTAESAKAKSQEAESQTVVAAHTMSAGNAETPAYGEATTLAVSNPSGDGKTYTITPKRVIYTMEPFSFANEITSALEGSSANITLDGATYSSSNDKAVSVDSAGMATINGVGIATLTATLANDQGTVSQLINVNPLNLSDNQEASIAPIPEQTYNGSAVRPSFTVTVGQNTLVEGVDYTASYINNNGPGTATAIANGLGNYTGNVSTTFTIVQGSGSSPEPEPGPGTDRPEVQRVYRLYNPYTGWHLYTESLNEYDVLATYGWKQEGIAWYSPETGPDIYRLYNPYTGWHFYTENAYEREVLVGLGWQPEGVSFHSAPDTGIPVYRLYNPGNGLHLFTTSENECNVLESLHVGAWSYEGIAWYGARVGAAPVG